MWGTSDQKVLLILLPLLVPTAAWTSPQGDQRCKEAYGQNWAAEFDNNGNVIGCKETACFAGVRDATTGKLSCCQQGTSWQPYPGSADLFAGACCAPGDHVMVDNGAYACCAPGHTYKSDGKTGTCYDNDGSPIAPRGGVGGPRVSGPGVGGPGVGGPGVGGPGVGGPGIGGPGIGGPGVGGPGVGGPGAGGPGTVGPGDGGPGIGGPGVGGPGIGGPAQMGKARMGKARMEKARMEKKNQARIMGPATPLAATAPFIQPAPTKRRAVLARNFNGAYVPGGEYGGVFRVCESEAQCSDEGKGAEVSSDGSWTLQDVIGLQTVADKGYISATAPYMAYSTVFHTSAAAFTGETYCSNGQCSICMRLPAPNGLGLLKWPDDGRFYLAPTANPLNCLAFSFQETPCLKGPTSSASPSSSKTEL
ncbi:hypothetical protein MMC17_003034 [Xylographa soralifera]|nr:hypothetical protein [Xylographa soralifera]